MRQPKIPQAAWDAADYARNSASQQVWARELLAQIQLRGDERILDVGCGDGKITAELARAVPRGAVTGVDAAPEMIRFARQTFPRSAFANLNFEIMDARELRLQERYEVVFSNAALHWVDDHRAFLQGAAQSLQGGGRLLISCGGRGNAQEVFVALRGVLRRQPWRECFRKMEAPYFFYAPAQYQEWLPRCGFQVCRLGLVNKDLRFKGVASFAGWFRTTWHPYTRLIAPAQREAFIAAVVQRYLTDHPPDPAGQVLVRMVRLEIHAIKV